MSWINTLFGAKAGAQPETPAPAPPLPPAASQGRMTESASEQGWTRLTGDGIASQNPRDLTPLSQDRMQRLADWLWQSNVLANRLIEIPLAFLLAEGVELECKDDDQQDLLWRFWHDPINNWPEKLEGRIRDLALTGEQCYIVHTDEAGFVRLGYLDPAQIATVIMDPDNPEQPVGVITKKDARGRYHKYKVLLAGEDDDLFTRRTAQIRATDFTDGECLLFQINKRPTGTRGRSDLLAAMDWLDAYDEFMFGELDRQKYLRAFAWDVTLNGADEATVKKFDADFRPPAPNSKFVHNDQVALEAKSPTMNASDGAESARLIRNHVLGGATLPEHWFGGGGEVNRSTAQAMDGPTKKIHTMRQQTVKRMLETIGRIVLWKAARVHGQVPDWSSEKWTVYGKFPELYTADISKLAAALHQVASACVVMMGEGLITRERALSLVADVATRFGQEIDVDDELDAAEKEHLERQAQDVYSHDPQDGTDGQGGQNPPPDKGQPQ